MRNLKRALSLALASVMLLGMMVVGSSAASISDFSDSDAITQAEAVEITTGLGIFEGYDDGTFQPETPVTRAQMAVIITKIMHNVGGDPSIYEGADIFDDVPAWAEGYVNMAHAMGIIVGTGPRTFTPDRTVSTAEAATMLLKALGYYGAGDPLGEDWKLTAVDKATYLGLYGDLKLGMNDPLTRENVAVMVNNAIFAQLVAFNDTRGQYVKTTDRDVVVTNGTIDPLNTLAFNTYGLYKTTGQVVANGYTDIALSATERQDGQTSVLFDEDVDLNLDGRVDVYEGETYEFDYPTGLDMIAHAADVYYTWENRAPVVVAITDQATLAAVIDFSWNSTTLSENATAAGFQKNSILDFVDNDDDPKNPSKVTNLNFAVNFDLKARYDDGVGALVHQEKDSKGVYQDVIDKLVVVSNSGNKAVDEVIILDQYLDTMESVDEIRGQVEYTLAEKNADLNIVMDEVDEDDYVIVTKIGNDDDIYIVSAADVVDGNLTRITGRSNANADVKRIVVDGTTYKASSVAPIASNDFTEFADIADIGGVTMVMDEFGDVIGLAQKAAPANYAYVAQWGFRHNTSGLNTNEDVLTALIYFADGTSGIYEVDTDPDRSDVVGEKQFSDALKDAANEKVNEAKKVLNGKTDSAKLLADGGYKGIYDVTVRANGKVEINMIETLVNTDEDNLLVGADEKSTLEKAGVKLVKKHSTLVDGTSNVTANNYNLMNNDDTVYFYVSGAYDTDNLKVNVVTGIDNVDGITNTYEKNGKKIADPTIDSDVAGNNIGYGIREAFYSTISSSKVIKDRAEIDAMLIQGKTVADTTVFYYNEGDYVVQAANSGSGYVVIFTLYSLTDGSTVEYVWDNNGDNFDTASEARSEAARFYDGFYEKDGLDRALKVHKEDNMEAAEKNSNDGGVIAGTATGTYYIVNDTAYYDEYTRNLFTEHYLLGAISGDVQVIDVCDSGLNTLAKLVRAIRSDDYKGDVKLSYRVKDLETKVIFVSVYDPDGTEASDGNTGRTTYTVSNITITDGTKVSAVIKNRDGKTAPEATKNVTVEYTLTYVLSSGAERTYTKTTTGTAAVDEDGTLSDTVDGLFNPVNGAIPTLSIRVTVRDGATNYTASTNGSQIITIEY